MEEQENSYTQRMQLKIEEVNWSDFGTYSCVSRNSLGTVRTNVQLQGDNKRAINFSKFEGKCPYFYISL